MVPRAGDKGVPPVLMYRAHANRGPRQQGKLDVDRGAIIGTNPLYAAKRCFLPLSLLLAFRCCRESLTKDRFL